MARSTRAKAEELERLLSSGVRDDAPSDLRQLATLATTVSEHTSLEAPSPEFRAELRQRLLEEDPTVVPLGTRLRRRIDDATARWRHSARAAAASAVASTLIGTTGVAVAAQAALPGDLLYEIKRVTESVRVTFAASDAEEGRLYLAFARERLDEVEALTAERDVTEVGATLEAMDTASAAGANLILQAASLGDAEALTDELDQFAESQRARLLVLADTLPADLQPAVEQSLEVLRRIEIQAGIVMDPECAFCELTAAVPDTPPLRVVLPGDGPAVSGDCDCVGDASNPAPRDSTIVGSDGVTGDGSGSGSQDPGTTGTDGTPDDGGSDDVLGEVTEPVEGVTESASEVIDDVTESASEIVDDLASDLGVDDTVSEISSTVDEVVDPVDDLLPGDDPSGDLLPTDDPTGGLLGG